MKSLCVLWWCIILASTWAHLPLDSDCQESSDCESETCFSGFQPPDIPGKCVCNVTTNVGCEDDEQCGIPEGLMDGFPMCLTPVIQCNQDSDCQETNRCFVGFQPPDSPGTCRCNSETNAGCDEPEFCSDIDIAFDGFPRCVLPVGEDCDSSHQCENGVCFQSLLVPGTCACVLETNFGCDEGEQCVPNPNFADVPPICIPTEPTASPVPTGTPGRKGIGEECQDDSECDSDRCFVGFQPPDTPGTCQCNSETNAGCDERKTCTDAETAFDGLPVCTVCGDPEGPCLNMENWPTCRRFEREGCINIEFLESCPLQFRCGDTPAPSGPGESTSTGPPSPEPSPAIITQTPGPTNSGASTLDKSVGTVSKLLILLVLSVLAL